MMGRWGARWMAIGLLGAVGILAFGSDAFGGTFKWVDRDGNVRYTDRPPQPDEVAPPAASVPTSAGPAAPSPAMLEFMQLSGLHQQLEWMAVNTRSQLQAQLGALEAEERASVDRVAAVAFSADRLQSLVRESLSARVDDAKITQAAGWFRTTTGRKITAAEIAAAMPQAQEDIAKFARARRTNPIEPKRLERLQRLEEAAGTSEFSFDLLVAVAEGMRRGAEPYLPVERRRALGSGDKHIASAKPKAVEELRATTLVGLEFAYRDISDADLDAYLAFLSSPGGRALTADVHQALLHAVRTSTEDAIVAIAQVIPPHRWGENRQREAPAPKPLRL